MLYDFLLLFSSLSLPPRWVRSAVSEGESSSNPHSTPSSTLPVAAISFLSGCTVLSMTIVTLFRSRGGEVSLNRKISSLLALGGIAGGLAGKYLFDLALVSFSSANTVSLIQSSLLAIMVALVFLFNPEQGADRSQRVFKRHPGAADRILSRCHSIVSRYRGRPDQYRSSVPVFLDGCEEGCIELDLHHLSLSECIASFHTCN